MFHREINIKDKILKKNKVMINMKIRVTILFEGEKPAKDFKGDKW